MNPDQRQSVDFGYLQDELCRLEQSGRGRTLVPRISSGVTFQQEGRRIINFGSNDYLGLAGQPIATPAASGAGASPLVCGWTEAHDQLSKVIARFEATQSATLFPSGYAACCGVAATLPGKQDLILSDALNHASLIDGCRLSAADCIVFPHRDCDAVRQLLEENHAKYQKIWIITDAVFSMDGHVAPLRELCDVADHFNAVIVADEAHGTGVLGEDGSGVCQELAVKHRVPIRVGTLSKAIGGQGGFVAAPKTVVDYLINRCRTLIYSTALSPAAVAKALDSLGRVSGQPWRRQRVRDNARKIRWALQIPSEDFEVNVPIISWVIGDDHAAVNQSRRLWDLGIYVPVIRPPTVPEGTSRLRISLSADHTDQMLDQLISALRSAN